MDPIPGIARIRRMRSVTVSTTLTAICIAVAGTAISACTSGERETAPRARSSARTEPTVTLPHGVTVSVPTGWHLVRKPINNVIYPDQVLAAASFPVRVGRTTPGCRRVLEQEPPGGVLVQVIEYTRQQRLRPFPARKRPFRLPKRAYAAYECAGPSYNVVFRDHGRALQAFGILDRRLVDSRIRREAIQLLSSIRFARRTAGRHLRRAVLAGVRVDFRSAIRGPSGFEDCFLERFRRQLTRDDLQRLVALRVARGEPSAARAMNGLAVKSGDACGGRRWVPELTSAAHGLAAT
jgi:hypothetical protein